MKKEVLIAIGMVAAAFLLFAAAMSMEPSGKVPKTFPTGAFANEKGVLVRLGDELRGAPAWVSIWGTWCLPCLRDHDEITALAGSGRIRVAGVAVYDSALTVGEWAARRGNPYSPSLVDPDGRILSSFGVSGVPLTVLTGADGSVVKVWRGALTDGALEREFGEEIKRLKQAADVPAGL